MDTCNRLKYFAAPAACGACLFILLRLFSNIPLKSITEPSCNTLKALIDAIPFKDCSSNGLVKAFLTGDRSSLDNSIIDTFRASGASHLLALSGLHLGIIYEIIHRLTRISGNSSPSKIVRATITTSLSTYYTVMTGASPSTVRALLFIIIKEICSFDAERKPNGVRILFLALLIQLAITPSSIHSAGFQLSYLAMTGLTLVGIPLQRWYPGNNKLNPLKKIWDASAISIGCQIFTAPLAWKHFHSFPSHFIITNILALPLTSAVMMISILCILLSAVNICPGFLVVICNRAVQLLIDVLRIIGSM